MSCREEVETRVLELVQVYVPERRKHLAVNGSSEFATDLDINSARLVDLILDLEEIFGLVPADNYQFKTVGDVTSYVVAQKC